MLVQGYGDNFCHCGPGRSDQRRRSAGYGAVAAAGDFMKRASRQPTARESCVQLGDSERKHRFRPPASASDLLDLRAQRLYGGLGPQACS